MADWEKDHIVDAFSFELNMVMTPAIKERFLSELLANVADELAQRVGKKIGLVPKRRNPNGITPEAGAPVAPKAGKKTVKASPALSMDKPADAIKGRKVAILVADGVSAKHVAAMKERLNEEGALYEVIAKFPGTVKSEGGKDLMVDRPAPNAASVLYDAVFIPGGATSAQALATYALTVQFVNEAHMHYKPIAALGEGTTVLAKANVPVADAGSLSSELGVVTAAGARDTDAFLDAFVEAMKEHRHFDREVETVPG
jgi:catalase